MQRSQKFLVDTHEFIFASVAGTEGRVLDQAEADHREKPCLSLRVKLQPGRTETINHRDSSPLAPGLAPFAQRAVEIR